jgi:hypothetical protein
MFQTNPKGLAVKIRAQLGAEISHACAMTTVPEAFLAALISVENARLDPHASRFEKAVFEKLKALRNPLKFWRREWSGITPRDLRGLSDEALINLATSFGYTQIMGWHCLHNLRNLDGSAASVAQLRDSKLHLLYAVQLLELVARRYLKVKDYGAVLHIWNSGSPTGKTFDPGYVANALAVKNCYASLSPVPTIETLGVPAPLPF